VFKKEQEKWPILNGRPVENHGPPVHLFHPVFSQFQHTFTNLNLSLTTVDYSKANRYIYASAALYDNEALQQEAILASLNAAIRFNLHNVESEDSTMPGYFVPDCAGFGAAT